MACSKLFFFCFVAVAVVFPRQVLSFHSSDFLVVGLEEQEPAFGEFDGNMYAGLLPIDLDVEEPSGKLSFWLFEPNDKKESLTIWLNGGPGCSSYGAGLFLECSPVTYPHHEAGHGRTSAQEALYPNEEAWTRATNMLFVEQPTSVGFSYGPEVQDEEELSRDFYNFLLNFMETFPHMTKMPVYIVGESYAGMYVPSIAHYIYRQNQQHHPRLEINLSGIGLGNGWVDGMAQGSAVIDYAYWHGMIDMYTREELWKVWRKCEEKGLMKTPFHEFTTPDECAVVQGVLIAAGKNVFPRKENYAPNQYDITTWDNYPIINTRITRMSSFFNNPEVRKKLHFDHEINLEKEWAICMPGAGRRLEELLPGEKLLRFDQPESVVPYIAELLDEAKIRVLVYAGDRDLSTNLQGSEQVLNNMDWSGKKDWFTADRFLWMVDGAVAGYVKTHKNLDMLLVQNSGHLVPYNVPIPALDLITRLVNDKSFGDIPLPKIDFTEYEKSKDEDFLPPRSLVTALWAIAFFFIGMCFGSKRNQWPYQKIR